MHRLSSQLPQQTIQSDQSPQVAELVKTQCLSSSWNSPTYKEPWASVGWLSSSRDPGCPGWVLLQLPVP